MGDTQFPLFPKAKKYRLAGMGDATSLIDAVTGGKATEITKGLSNIETALKVSTAASVLTALLVLLKR